MTAAPGPQQPDEVACRQCGRKSSSDGAPVGWRNPSCGLCGSTFWPAAPSAQPDERRCTCPEDEAGRMATYTCQRGTEPHSVGCPRWGTPAEPVRDTEEGRR